MSSGGGGGSEAETSGSAGLSSAVSWGRMQTLPTTQGSSPIAGGAEPPQTSSPAQERLRRHTVDTGPSWEPHRARQVEQRPAGGYFTGLCQRPFPPHPFLLTLEQQLATLLLGCRLPTATPHS